MNKALIILASLAACLPLSARWLSTTYDFGSILEDDGPRQGCVYYVNTGLNPVMINRVKATCGCTSVGATEGLINPGDTAKVWFTYNPAGRPGRFEKHVKVYMGENDDVTSIKLRGTVIGNESTLAVRYPYSFGPMRLSTNEIDLGKVIYGKSRHESISGYNQSTDTLHLAWSETPRAFSLGASSRTVAPGDIFTIGAYLNPRDLNEIGSQLIKFKLYPQAADTASYAEITMTADIVPNTSSLSAEEMRNAPSALIFPPLIELGEISGTKAIPIKFNLQNEGKSPLITQRICIPGSQVLRLKQLPSKIAPGKVNSVSAEILPQFIPEGPFRFELQVVTNDPLHPLRSLSIVGVKK